jgi:hypothetical protein
MLFSKDMLPKTAEEHQQMAKVPYMVAVGSLMYAAMGSCPDIAFAVQQLSQYMLNPSHGHWTQAQHAVHYLSTTQSFTLVLGGSNVTLMGWMDSNLAQTLMIVTPLVGTFSCLVVELFLGVQRNNQMLQC